MKKILSVLLIGIISVPFIDNKDNSIIQVLNEKEIIFTMNT